ncbi:hypothetical protein [Hymenobacter nivis]|uniref:DUF4239 domain-containing protein n=1 Tax=Hymenobacter nivis TaxID=1850093 RepID=A0A502GVQ5_9BACT|nr:hypothetical protein [Hymenobacter nivis]TPG65542.1 hypothetical protein EAH73_13870 [Hymenobacter nivis]
MLLPLLASAWLAVVDSYWATLAYPVGLGLAVWLGGWAAERWYLRRGRVWKPIGVEGGIFGMFGLLLSFTLVASGAAVKARDATVHAEASSISGLYRQSQLYPPALRARVRAYLLASLRDQLAHPTPNAAECLRLVHRADSLNRAFDTSLLVHLAGAPTDRPVVEQLLALAATKNTNYFALLYTFRERTPRTILVALVVLSLGMCLMIGFMNRFQDYPNPLIPIVFVATVAVLVTTIRDLDNPGRGVVTPDYDDLTNVAAVIHQGP